MFLSHKSNRDPFERKQRILCVDGTTCWPIHEPLFLFVTFVRLNVVYANLCCNLSGDPRHIQYRLMVSILQSLVGFIHFRKLLLVFHISLRTAFHFRVPFELNSTFRWTMISCIQLISNLTGETVTATTITLFFGFNMFVDTCLNDIKSLFNRIDRLSKDTKSGGKMLSYCTEAIDLHGRITRYSI